MDNDIRIIPNSDTLSGKRHSDTVNLLIKLEKEGALLATTKNIGNIQRRVWYAAPEDEQERKDWESNVKSGVIRSYTLKEFIKAHRDKMASKELVECK